MEKDKKEELLRNRRKRRKERKQFEKKLKAKGK
jgi:hypothetical protein